MHYKVLVWPVVNPPDVPISQVFDWNATSGLLQDVPLLEGASYRLNVMIGFSDGYAYSEDVFFDWPPLAAPTTPTTTTTTLAPAAVFKPSLENRYEVSVEEAVVYGTGGTLDGGQVDLLLDLAVPDTETDGPRPLLVHIHGGGFVGRSRWPQWDAAARGWVAASIDYRLAGDDPLPGPRVQRFFDAVGGKSATAVHRSVVAAVEDTLVALDYLLGRADELNIDTDRIVLKGESAGAYIALTVAYCADKFENSGPTIAAVIDFWGKIVETFCGGGTAIDPGEAAVFMAHGTEDKDNTHRHALSIVDGAKPAGITYELYTVLPFDGLKQTTADGRKIDDLMYEFLDRVLYGEYVPTATVAPTTTTEPGPTTTTTTTTAPTTTTTKPPGFPRVCQAWNGIQNRPNLTELERIAHHDLWFTADLGLVWEISEDQPYRGLSTTLTDINGDPTLTAAKEKKAALLRLNPHIKTILSVLYREAAFVGAEEGLDPWEHGHFPPNSPYWIRDADGAPVPGWGEDADKDGVLEVEEILSSVTDFRRPEVIELIGQKALALAESGIVDGIFLDWWNEHEQTASSYIDKSTYYMTAEEEIEARLAILRRIRELVGDDFLVLVNPNQRTAPRSAPYVNGIFMEVWKPDYSKGYPVDQLRTVEDTLSWASENLQEPRINCLNGWRVVYDYGNEAAQVTERDSAENRQWMRVFPTLPLTHSDGHVIFGDDNHEPTWDHYHNWYDFWDADLGQPVSDKRQLLDGVEGLFIREFTNGYAVYNRSGVSQTIALPHDVKAVSTGLVANTHQLGDLDGEIYLGPTSGTPAG